MNKVDHLIILMMENRSFDHYLGYLKKDGFPNLDGLPEPLPVLLDKDGHPVPAWEMDGADFRFEGPPHEWSDMLTSYNSGLNDGFIKAYQAAYPTSADFRVPVGYYTKRSLPVLDSIARKFAICDHWYSAVLGSTWPNRKYFHSGRRDADRETRLVPPFPGFETTPMYDQIEDCRDANGVQLTWKGYVSDLPFLAFWYPFALGHVSNFEHVHNFVRDCQENTLPTISLIDPPFQIADDHPPSNPALGQKFIGLIVDALTHSDSWTSSALLILYDESGGFYDHVSPPPVEAPSPPEDDHLGFRVPALIVSPYARQGVISTPFTHTSILRSINTRWGVNFDSRFGNRWQTANDIWGCFDFDENPRPKDCYTGDPQSIFALDWGKGIQSRLIGPVTNFENLLERIFILPELKALDRRAIVFESLSTLENKVITLKRVTLDATAH